MGNNKYKVLVIEDDDYILNLIETLLTMNGYQSLTAQTCDMGHTMFISYNPDIIILDLGLPDKDGIDFIKNVRQNFTVPIVVLSARTTEQDKIIALDSGANDYITKPFGSGELLARVRAALRIRRQNIPGALPKSQFKTGGLTIHYDSRRVYVGNCEIKLSQTEYNILSFLSEHSGRVMTYSSIVKTIWGCVDKGSTKKLQVNMANLRKKLGSKPGSNYYILNELGVGYRMVDKDCEIHETVAP